MKDLITRKAPITTRAPSIEEATALLSARNIDVPVSELFLFQAGISSGVLDSYYTRMAVSTLQNFANDATAGVQFLDSHEHDNLGYGRSISGAFENGQTLAWFYTVRGINFGGELTYASTDDFIRAVKAQIAKDVSVGFSGGRIICDICGMNVYGRTDCPHIPGLVYGDGTTQVTATATVEDAHLNEVSAVYDGATPGAMILKIQQEADAGHIVPDAARMLEVRYKGVNLAGVRKTWPGATTNGGKRMEEAQIIEITSQAGAPAELDAAGQLRWLAEQFNRTRPLVAEGEAYRKALIADAMAEGVRAMGQSFSAETYRAMLEAQTTDRILVMKGDWQRMGDARLKGGASVQDGPEHEAGKRRDNKSIVPDAAYMA